MHTLESNAEGVELAQPDCRNNLQLDGIALCWHIRKAKTPVKTPARLHNVMC